MSDVPADPSAVATATEPAEIVTVTVSSHHGSDPREVEGRLVVPGLALTPTPDTPDRFSLTHVSSGRALTQGQCAEHIEEAAQRVREAGIDWTRDMHALVADPAVKDVARDLVHRCYGRCNPSTPAPPAWRVRCNTCDWEWEDEDNEGLDAKEAKRMADDHECEPDVEIAPPDGTSWFLPFEVKDDGTLPERARRG